MKAAGAPRILLYAEHASSLEDVRRLLDREGYAVAIHALGMAEPADVTKFELVVIDGSRAGATATTICRELRSRLADCFVPILVVTSDPSPSARFANLESGAGANLLR